MLINKPSESMLDTNNICKQEKRNQTIGKDA